MRRFSLLSAFVVLCSGCEPAVELRDIPVERIASVDTLVSSESAAIAYAIDLDVAASGDVFVADFMGNTVVAVDSIGTATSFGRRGEGPEEFSGPFALRAEGSVLFVHDRGNGRMKRMSQAGVLRSIVRTAPHTSRAPPYILPDGGMLVSTGGADSALVAEFDPDAQLKRRVGSPIAPLDGPGPILEIVRNGEIPGRLRNEGLVAGNATGDVWVALTAEGDVRRYDADGSLLWATQVEEPEMITSREIFFRRNREEAAPGSFFPLRYFMDLELVSEEAWVLLQTQAADPAVILSFGPGGRLTRRIEITGGGGATALAIGPAQSVVLFTQHDAQLLRAQLVSDGATP